VTEQSDACETSRRGTGKIDTEGKKILQKGLFLAGSRILMFKLLDKKSK
jgi:hypothetical protein